MKKYQILSLLLAFAQFSFAQDARKILQKSYLKCLSIQNGSYQSNIIEKPSELKDTIRVMYDCVFKKLPGDTVYDKAFHNQYYAHGKRVADELYTGDYLVTFRPGDSSGESISRVPYANRIKYLIGAGDRLYSPFTIEHVSWLPDKLGYEGKNQIKYVGLEKINTYSCYHIQVTTIPESKETDQMRSLKREYHYWINMQDFIPVQYTVLSQSKFQGDTLFDFRKETLSSYQLNKLKDEVSLSISSIPAYYHLKEYTPRQPVALLPEGSLAPDWSLNAANNEKISLSDLKGQVVLMDFFYESCLPCMQALPFLKALNEKYKSEGLKVIGVDSYDKKENGIAEFLKHKGITYPVLLDEAYKTDTDYHISGYPTIYLIDKQGKILFSMAGLSKSNEEKLEELIKQNL